jgi:hypothetical protein
VSRSPQEVSETFLQARVPLLLSLSLSLDDESVVMRQQHMVTTKYACLLHPLNFGLNCEQNKLEVSTTYVESDELELESELELDEESVQNYMSGHGCV